MSRPSLRPFSSTNSETGIIWVSTLRPSPRVLLYCGQNRSRQDSFGQGRSSWEYSSNDRSSRGRLSRDRSSCDRSSCDRSSRDRSSRDRSSWDRSSWDKSSREILCQDSSNRDN